MLSIKGEDHMKINDDLIMGMEQVDDLHGTTIGESIQHVCTVIPGIFVVFYFSWANKTTQF